jgi:Mg2+/Co2+ transporter CorB
LNDVSLETLFSLLILMLVLSAFFSGSESSMMSLNRYRLKHLTKKGNRAAIRVAKLLQRPENLFSSIRMGNQLTNNFAAIIATLIVIRLLGNSAIALMGVLLTLVMLIFSEAIPKTITTSHPERTAFLASWLLRPLSYALYPAVIIVRFCTDNIVKLFATARNVHIKMNSDELRTLVDESGDLLPAQHQGMLLNLFDLEKADVEDIMIPRNEVEGLDLELPIPELLKRIRTSEYTRLPVYEGDINKVVGILHLRNLARAALNDEGAVTHAVIRELSDEPYFVPESTKLHLQLLNFQTQKCRMALVVDEYGDIQGIVTQQDLLEEIVGDFTTQKNIVAQDDNWFLIDGGTFVRDINRTLEWELPANGPKTLNGLAMEYLENIPDADVGFQIGQYLFETTQVTDKIIVSLRASKVF